jgi:hypothetical protein
MLKKSFLPLTTLSLALSLELVISTSLPATAKSQSNSVLDLQGPNRRESVGQLLARRARLGFKVPRIRASRNRYGGAARGSCSLDQTSQLEMKTLLPDTNIGLTVAAQPTFFFLISNTSATEVKEAKFILLHENHEENRDDIIYQTTLPLSGKGGVMSVTLPPEAGALEVGKEYRWEAQVSCSGDGDESSNPHIDGSIKRVQPDAELARKLEKASPRDRVALYAKAGYWNSSLETLAKLRLANPNDQELKDDWQELLETVGLGTIAQEPLVMLGSNSSQTP